MLALIHPAFEFKDDFLAMVQEYRAKSEYYVYHDPGQA